jgi:hypothetical protein
MGLFGRGPTRKEKLAWNDTLRTIMSVAGPLAVLLSLVAIWVSVLQAKEEAERQAGTEVRQRRDQAGTELRQRRDQARTEKDQAALAIKLEAARVVTAAPTCAKAVTTAAMLTSIFGKSVPDLAAAIRVLQRASRKQTWVCSVERFISLGSSCLGQIETITGTEGDDILVGSPGSDVIVGRGGSDQISGGGGDDIICGDEGNDVMSGGNGNDQLSGGLGIDRCDGGAGLHDTALTCEVTFRIP